MSFKKGAQATTALISMGIVAIAALAVNRHGVAELNPFKAPREVNAISGIEGENGPVLVVKIDDTSYSHPQVGIEKADLIYIEQVEGGLTRLAAVFSREIPPTIGPVRSARITDVELLSQYGYIAFAYSGAQSKLRPVLAAAHWKDVGAERLGATFYTNDPLRTRPYALMMNASAVMEKLRTEATPIARAQQMGWNFGKAPDSGTAISAVDVHWPAARYGATWSPEQKRWLLSHNGAPNLSADGTRLSASTFVIQKVRITPSEYRDKVGGVTPLSEVVGSGTGYILRDGQVFPGRWNRPSSESGTTWSDGTGKVITFAPGQIWVALTDQEPTFLPISREGS